MKHYNQIVKKLVFMFTNPIFLVPSDDGGVGGL